MITGNSVSFVKVPPLSVDFLDDGAKYIIEVTPEIVCIKEFFSKVFPAPFSNALEVQLSWKENSQLKYFKIGLPESFIGDDLDSILLCALKKYLYPDYPSDVIVWMARKIKEGHNLMKEMKGFSLYEITGTTPSNPAEVWADFGAEDSGGLEKSAKGLPAMDTVVKCPECSASGIEYESTLFRVIMHLNDRDEVSREYIADWIDELHESGVINAEFEPWNEGESDD